MQMQPRYPHFRVRDFAYVVCLHEGDGSGAAGQSYQDDHDRVRREWHRRPPVPGTDGEHIVSEQKVSALLSSAVFRLQVLRRHTVTWVEEIGARGKFFRWSAVCGIQVIISISF